MKKLVKILAVLVILLLIALVAAVVFLDKVVKTGVEQVGPEITKTDVKLNDVKIGLLSGSVKLAGLTVGNPQGYKMPQALNLGSVAVEVNPASLLAEKIVVRSINVQSPEITLEGGLKDNNLTKLMENIQAAAAAVTPAETKDSKEAKPSAQPGKKLQVDEFIISGAKVHLKMDLLAGKEMTVNLPDISLKDLGKGENGITPAELTKQVFKELLGSTTAAVTSAVANVGKVVGDAAKSAGEGVKKATKSIGDLFKK